MDRYDLIIIGAGPAGLSAAIEGSRLGMKTIVFDENARPGGQLFKQIHKFFGSKEHQAKIRGINIGEKLLKEANEAGVAVMLNAVVAGIYKDKSISVFKDGSMEEFHGNSIIVATGASEKTIPFKNWTMPGIIGAGAAQTMMNINGVKPGKKVLMVGSGNVGLVVSFQLMQAGCEVVGIIDAAPKVGGYGVHASKLSRTGVPFYLSHTVIEAKGKDCVESVVIAELDKDMKVIKGTEKEIETDTVCLAVGLNPMSQLIRMAGAKMKEAGGLVPVSNEYGETSIPGIFVAGDVAGIEEASSAMINGHIAALSAAKRSGFINKEEFSEKFGYYMKSIEQLRQGMFAVANRGKDIKKTDEGIDISQSLLSKGYIADSEIVRFPGFVSSKGIHPVIECTQNIPCNPCQDACKFGCIKIGENITALPCVDREKECKNCGMCVATCSGQAIFLVNEDCGDGYATVTLPYEFFPLPKVGTIGKGLNRSGEAVCDAEVTEIKTSQAFDKTALLTMKVPKDMAMKARFFRA